MDYLAFLVPKHVVVDDRNGGRDWIRKRGDALQRLVRDLVVRQALVGIRVGQHRLHPATDTW